jgi:hypothetical protein
MRGTITTRELMIHTVTIVRLWGPRTYLRCLGAVLRGHPTTFLTVLYARHR